MRKSFLMLAIGAALLTGCDMYDEGIINTQKVQVSEAEFRADVPVSEATDAYLTEIANNYHENGEGPVRLTVTYDPKSAGNTAMGASDTLSRLVSGLKARGVGNITADILPVHNLGEESHVIISYASYVAKAPENCGQMSGMEDNHVYHQEDYRLGCTLEHLYAKQVANPRDLLGRDDDGSTKDGRRAANITEPYRAGVQNEALDGIESTD